MAKFEPPDMFELERDTTAVRCECGGYAGEVDSTVDECKRYGCGRDKPGSECCAASFECCLCGKRYAGSRPAPELGW